MNKTTIRLLTLLIVTLASFLIREEMPISILGVLYTVAGIMFSVGIGLIVSFSMQGIKNKKIIRAIRSNLNSVRNKYIFYFCISTISFVTYEWSPKTVIEFEAFKKALSFNLPVFTGAILLYSIFYFIINFLSIQHLSNQVFDEINK